MELCKQYAALITKQGWMFDSRPKLYREYVLKHSQLITLVQLAPGAFESISGEVVKTSAFVMCAGLPSANIRTAFINLDEVNNHKVSLGEILKYIAVEKTYSPYYFAVSTVLFDFLEDSQLAYWLGNEALQLLNYNSSLSKRASTRHGLVTGNKDFFVRMWFEISNSRFSTNGSSGKKWYPYCKGGAFRKWYGNRECCVDWENAGERIRSYRNPEGKIVSSNYNLKYIFNKNINWSDVRSNEGVFSARYTPLGSLFDTAGPALFCNDESELLKIMGYLNSSTCNYLLSAFCRGLHYTPGSIGSLPYKDSSCQLVREYVNSSISISRFDYDSQETSWDFKRNPLTL